MSILVDCEEFKIYMGFIFIMVLRSVKLAASKMQE